MKTDTHPRLIKKIPMSKNANYKAGYRAERKAFETLKGYGFLVIRSAKSGSPFDLVGINEKEIVLIQVKLCAFGKLPSFEKTREMIEEIKVPENTRKELWVMERRRGFHYFPLTNLKSISSLKGEGIE